MPDTRYCPKCGEACGAEDRFCTNCRTELRSSSTRSGSMSRSGGAAAETPGTSSTEMGLPVNAVLLDRYRILKLLGAGGMGRVYLAEDQKLSMPVAIKVLRDILTQDPVSIKRLITEAKTSILLAHPNILRLHNFEDGETAKFLVMEYVEGESLADRIAREGKLSEEDTRAIAIEVCRGLEHAHLKKVIHRDMKPGNVMLGKDGSVKIADFGLARLCHDSIARMTSQLSTGTLQYMSPEQLDGEIGESSDLYALGITIYEMLAGDPPFVTGEITAQIRNKVPKPIDGISDEMNRIVLKCLEKKKENRLPGIRSLREELDGTARQSRAVATEEPHAEVEAPAKRAQAAAAFFSQAGQPAGAADDGEAEGKSQIAALKSAGSEAYNASRFGEAIAAWQQALALDPGNADLQHSLAEAKRQADLVIREAERRKNDESRKQWFDDATNRVTALFQQGNWKEAEHLLQQALQHFPNHATLMEQMARVREKLAPVQQQVRREVKPKSMKKILLWTGIIAAILVILGIIGNLIGDGPSTPEGPDVTGSWQVHLMAVNLNVIGEMSISGSNDALQINTVATYPLIYPNGFRSTIHEEYLFSGNLDNGQLRATCINGMKTIDGAPQVIPMPMSLSLMVSPDGRTLTGQLTNATGMANVEAHKQ
jgi:tetratricopeptide (TPR) repeat protein